MQLDKAVIARLKAPICRVWAAIASDVRIDDSEGNTNEIAIELCMDAGHLVSYGEDKAAEDLVRELATEHGYNTLLRFLGTQIKLA